MHTQAFSVKHVRCSLFILSNWGCGLNSRPFSFYSILPCSALFYRTFSYSILFLLYCILSWFRRTFSIMLCIPFILSYYRTLAHCSVSYPINWSDNTLNRATIPNWEELLHHVNLWKSLVFFRQWLCILMVRAKFTPYYPSCIYPMLSAPSYPTYPNLLHWMCSKFVYCL